MRILIVGSDANAYSIAEKLSKNENVDVVFTTSKCEKLNNFAANIDISETDNEELLDFVIANEIALTVVTSISAIENDIAGFFNDARRLIFAPVSEVANIALYKSAAKKMMYRLKIPTMKFGIFERENQAIDYLSTARRPVVIKNDTHIPGDFPIFAKSFPKAKSIVEKSYISPENKIIIEDYIDAREVSMYFLTDGYTALPIGSCSSNDNDYAYPNSIYAPDNYISDELEAKIMREVIYPIIDDIASRSQAYCGILGVDLFVDKNMYNVIEFNPFFKQMHLQAILPLIKSDICDLFLSAASGSLSDEYEYIKFYDCSSISKIINKYNPEKLQDINDDDINCSYTSSANIILTQIARTSSRAKINLENNIKFISKDGE